MLEKSRGVLLFAYNTDAVDYVAIAEQCARLVHHTLGLPVTLVTDHGATPIHIDQTIIVSNTLTNFRVGYAGGTQWRNGNRYQAYELSPYEETVLIDTDYLMLDQSLLLALNTTEDYTLMHYNQTPTQSMTGNMGVLSLDYVWATAITFKRTHKTELLFNLVGRIQRNYAYYRKLYDLREPNFRNDYAFAIANNIVNGYDTNKSQGMPWSLMTLDNKVDSLEVKGNNLIVRELATHVIPRQNLHVMDKEYLLSDNYIKFVDAVCQS